MDARDAAVEICRFVRAVKGLTNNERDRLIEHIIPIIYATLNTARQSWRSRMGLTTSCDAFLIRAETAEKEVKRLNEIADRLAAAGMSK